MNTQLIQEQHSEHREFLYPHDSECICLIVPKTTRLYSFLFKIITSHTIHSIIAVFFVVVLCRIIMLRANVASWFQEFLTTFGIYLAQNNLSHNYGRCERMWLICVLMFTVTSTALLSSVFYNSLVIDVNGADIDTFDQLAETNLTIYYPHTQASGVQRWTTLF